MSFSVVDFVLRGPCLQLAMLFCLACSWLCSFTSCRSALLPAAGPLFWLLFIRIISLFVFTQSAVLSFAHLLRRRCLRVRQSRPTSAVHTPSFAVWCLGLSRACAVLLLRSSWHSMSRSRSSWHSMNRSPWHSMALQRRFPTSSSPVHVLTHVFSSRFFTCCAWLRVVWLYPIPLAPLSSARCACRGRCLQAGRELRHAVFVATLVRLREHLVARVCASKVCIATGELHLSSGLALLGFPRSSTVVLSSPPGLVPEVVWLSPLRPPGSTPAEAQSLRLFAAVAAAVSCVPRGQRALLDADMLELIDRSACLVELIVVESCAPPVLVLSPQQARPSGRCSRIPPPRGLVERLFAPLGCSFRAAPVASLRLLLLTGKSWMIWTLLFCHVVDVMFFLTGLLCFVFLLHNCEGSGRRDPLAFRTYVSSRAFRAVINQSRFSFVCCDVWMIPSLKRDSTAVCSASLFACLLPLSSC